MKRTALAFIIAVVFIVLIFPTAKAAGSDEFLTVNEPRDNFMTSMTTVIVSGETLPQTSISVLVNGSQKRNLSVGAAGIFLAQVPVATKENIITIKTVFPSGKSEMVSRRVYQLEETSEGIELDYLIKTIKNFLILK